MALTSGSGVYVPPKPPKPSPMAQALAEHIAMQTGQTPTQVSGTPAVPELSAPGAGSAQLASYAGAMPRYDQAANLIQQYLLSQNSPYADTNYAKAVVKKAKKWGLDPRLLVAISGAETTLGKNPAAAPISAHNAWGYGGPYKGGGFEYPNWGQAANDVASDLAKNYFGKGLDTIPEISGTWAPLGAANDPNNVNQNWTDNVTQYYKDITNTKGGNPLLGVPAKKGLQELLYKYKLWDAQGGFYQNQDLTDAHMTHVHEAFSNPRVALKSIKVGTNRFNLTGGSNPYFTGHPETTGHTGNSWHYKNFPGTFGPDNRMLGEAIDWTGTPENLQAFYNWAANRYIGRGVYDYGTAAPGTPAGEGVWARPATQADVHAQDAQAQNVANTSGAISAAAFGDAPGFAKRRRKSGRSPSIDALIQALIQGQVGSQLLA